MKKLYNMGINRFHFLDAEFIGPGQVGKDRAKEFANNIIESGMKISFYADVRVDCIDKEVMELLCKAGLKSVFVGVESASNRILEKIKKGYKVDDIINAINVIKEVGITYRVGTLLAVPECSLDDIERSLKFFFNNNIYQAMNIVGVGSIFHELHLHLGTLIYNNYQDYSGDKERWKGEIPCYYSDDNVKLFIEGAREMHNFVLQRYDLVSKQDIDDQFRKKYLFSLRVVSLSGLIRLVQEIRNHSDSTLIIKEIFRKHDEFWLKQGGKQVNGNSRTTVGI